MLITANQRWQPDFLQTINAKKTDEFTVHDKYGNWITTRIYQVPGKLEVVKVVLGAKLKEPDWQWSETTIQSRTGASILTSNGWHIQRDNHSLQVEEKTLNNGKLSVRLVWHETPGPVETNWNLLREWLGVTTSKRR